MRQRSKPGWTSLVQELGVPAVLVYNAALIRADRPGELRYAQHQSAYAINVLGAITSATHLAPQMAKTGGGTILITGGMPAPDPTYTSLSLGKACGRALTHLLADEYGASGIHIATVIVSAEIAPGGPFFVKSHRRRVLAPSYPDAGTEREFFKGRLRWRPCFR